MLRGNRKGHAIRGAIEIYEYTIVMGSCNCVSPRLR